MPNAMGEEEATQWASYPWNTQRATPPKAQQGALCSTIVVPRPANLTTTTQSQTQTLRCLGWGLDAALDPVSECLTRNWWQLHFCRPTHPQAGYSAHRRGFRSFCHLFQSLQKAPAVFSQSRISAPWLPPLRCPLTPGIFRVNWPRLYAAKPTKLFLFHSSAFQT